MSTIGYDKRVAFSIEHVVRSQVHNSLHLNQPLTVCPRLILYHLYIFGIVWMQVLSNSDSANQLLDNQAMTLFN